MFNFEPKIPEWSLVKNPYYFKQRSDDRLLITVGDSWTYGDSLGNTKVRNGQDDPEYRLTHVYGAVLSDALNASWINLVLPGSSNVLMLSWLDQLLSQVTTNTTCVITLTESGRHEELRLLDSSYPTQQFALTQILAYTYNKINSLKLKYPQVKFVVSHNFTDKAEGIIELCERSWLEVMLGEQIQKNTHIVVSEHIAQMNYDRRFPDVLDVIERANQRVDLLDRCEHCNKEDTRHPTEEGHRLWAEYIGSQL